MTVLDLTPTEAAALARIFIKQGPKPEGSQKEARGGA